VVKDFWSSLPSRFSYVGLDEFIVMPNHIHGIINIWENPSGKNHNPLVGAIHELPLQGLVDNEKFRKQRRNMLISKIIGYYKMNTTKKINKLKRTTGSKLWQRNYYEHVIRDEKDLFNVREYIHNNPIKWELDKENPERKK
jgi:REP element-mobilizing transposase RayT